MTESDFRIPEWSTDAEEIRWVLHAISEYEYLDVFEDSEIEIRHLQILGYHDKEKLVEGLAELESHGVVELHSGSKIGLRENATRYHTGQPAVAYFGFDGSDTRVTWVRQANTDVSAYQIPQLEAKTVYDHFTPLCEGLSENARVYECVFPSTEYDGLLTDTYSELHQQERIFAFPAPVIKPVSANAITRKHEWGDN